jgi:hypothetical protein
MDSNTHSTSHPAGTPAGFQALVAELQRLADQDPNRLADGAWAERVQVLRGLADRLDGHWLAELAGLDARGAAGADQGLQAASTAASCVRTARALYRGLLTGTAQALAEGTISPAHAQVLASGTHDLPDHLAAEAEPVLLEAARRLDPPRPRRVIAQLRLVADPEGVDAQAERQHQQRGLWVTPTWEGMVAVNGLLDPEAGQTLLAALEPLARPANASDQRSPSQRRADALAELARRTLEGGRLPHTGGSDPSFWSPSTWTASSASMGWAARSAGRDRWTPRPVGGWPATGPSPGSWSPATPSTTPAAMPAWPGSYGPRWPCCPQSWVGRLPSRWRSAAPAASSPPSNAPPWPCAAAAVGSPAATGRWPGARPTICATGSMAAPPTWPTWRCCAGPTTGRSTRAGGGWPGARTAGWPPPHRTENTVPRREPAARLARRVPPCG